MQRIGVLNGSTIAANEIVKQALVDAGSNSSNIAVDSVNGVVTYQVPPETSVSEIMVSVTGLSFPAAGKVWAGGNTAHAPIMDFIINDKHSMAAGTFNNTLSTYKFSMQSGQKITVVLSAGAVEVAVVGTEYY